MDPYHTSRILSIDRQVGWLTGLGWLNGVVNWSRDYWMSTWVVIDIFNYACSVILKAKNGTKKILCYFFSSLKGITQPLVNTHIHNIKGRIQNGLKIQTRRYYLWFHFVFVVSKHSHLSYLQVDPPPPLDHQLLLFSFNATVVILVIFSNSCCFFIFIPKGNSNSRCVCVLHSIFCFVVPITDQ